MADRRRNNGPPSGTRPPVYASLLRNAAGEKAERPRRARKPTELRKIFLKTGLIPSASGSSYLEIEPARRPTNTRESLIAPATSLKIACAVHGPRPLPRSANYSPNLLLTTHVKYAPFAHRRRKGHIRDASERDLGVHLETAIRGAIIAERWPKSALDVTITVLEAEDDRWWGDASGSSDASWGMMNVLAGCITAAAAAIADARIDCLDLVAGGVAALVTEDEDETDSTNSGSRPPRLLLDPDPAEHQNIVAACVVGYLPSRDEITEIWLKGDTSEVASTTPGSKKVPGHEVLLDGAIDAARAARSVLAAAVRESGERFIAQSAGVPETTKAGTDVAMKT
ncbi:3' exoribonuclease family protein [Talaromyces stipitatus ATCC 10500]|uniref:3' exoribonuclease family protein n=1 Tax=Talaromyces stipitatus (strain ATCC 10500 / CBS 375.48 / QM 6759 / NRRL 1006) TaxID=441959 RepID=B8MBN2_TALSN|nr:3' exoribonuclease family protein [Talaromyces stipitatus ATCC 10500]EED18165.1 3' exoribonuclease family protein [Talaromyces stipitatus ATCC 10500]